MGINKEISKNRDALSFYFKNSLMEQESNQERLGTHRERLGPFRNVQERPGTSANIGERSPNIWERSPNIWERSPNIWERSPNIWERS